MSLRKENKLSMKFQHLLNNEIRNINNHAGNKN